MTPPDIAARLAGGGRVGEPVALVAAHPDDEVLGLGAHLHLFDRLTLIHLTDGAPLDMGDARRAGYADRDAYAAARAAELDAALAVLGVRPRRRLAYGLTDQTLVDRLPDLCARLARDLAGHASVFTHAYEGGHPDHDAAALAVAVARLRIGPGGPAAFEFAGYYGVGGALQANRFHADAEAPETAVRLDAPACARKARALAAHASQAGVLAGFAPAVERWRPAPAYDFAAPPPCGEAHYDRYGWALTSAAWRERAAAALAHLGRAA